MRSGFLSATVFALLASRSYGKGERPVIGGKDGKGPEMERVRVVSDEEMVATKDAFAIIEPVWWTGDIYGSYKDYESSLARFSRGQ